MRPAGVAQARSSVCLTTLAPVLHSILSVSSLKPPESVAVPLCAVLKTLWSWRRCRIYYSWLNSLHCQYTPSRTKGSMDKPLLALRKIGRSSWYESLPSPRCRLKLAFRFCGVYCIRLPNLELDALDHKPHTPSSETASARAEENKHPCTHFEKREASRIRGRYDTVEDP